MNSSSFSSILSGFADRLSVVKGHTSQEVSSVSSLTEVKELTTHQLRVKLQGSVVSKALIAR
jgi:hypothetical protein